MTPREQIAAWDRESKEAYAQRRANETGRAYIVGYIGDDPWWAALDCRMNRAGYTACGATSFRRFAPESVAFGR